MGSVVFLARESTHCCCWEVGDTALPLDTYSPKITMEAHRGPYIEDSSLITSMLNRRSVSDLPRGIRRERSWDPVVSHGLYLF